MFALFLDRTDQVMGQLTALQSDVNNGTSPPKRLVSTLYYSNGIPMSDEMVSIYVTVPIYYKTMNGSL